MTIYGFQGNSSSRAIDLALAASGKLLVKDTNITNCEAGIRLTTSGGLLQANLDNIRVENTDTHAVSAFNGALVTIKHSNLSNNLLAGVLAMGNLTTVNVEDTVLAFNNAGVNAGGAGARIRISDSTIVNNGFGVGIAAGAFVATAGDNRIDGNGSTTAPNETFFVE